VAVELTQASAELDALVAAPVPSGEDPTTWLPDELLILIVLQVGWRRGCEAVCRRWHGLCQDVAVKRQLRDGRWEEYAAGRLQPRALHGYWGVVACMALGPNETIYALCEHAVRVWSTRDGQLLQTFDGFTSGPLAVAQDGTMYCGTYDRTIPVWSGENGSHLRTLTGHTTAIAALAIGANGNVFSGSHTCARLQPQLMMLAGGRPSPVGPLRLRQLQSAADAIAAWGATSSKHGRLAWATF
jgi:hypothetical protein